MDGQLKEEDRTQTQAPKIIILQSQESLSHYTNLVGFKGIIDTGQIWASNVAYLNDRVELLYGIECASSALRIIVEDKKLHGWSETIKSVVGKIKAGKMPSTFVTCFCTKPDLLSQWRGYSGFEQGICLVFDRKKLSAIQSSEKLSLVRVQYGKISSEQSIARSLINSLITDEESRSDKVDAIEQENRVYYLLSRLIPVLNTKASMRKWSGGSLFSMKKSEKQSNTGHTGIFLSHSSGLERKIYLFRCRRCW